LTGEKLWRRYAELIVELGQVLRKDGWEADVNTVAPGTPHKQYALEMLRRAMDADTESVAALAKGCADTLATMGLEADSWLREGLMYDVLKIPPPPESCFADIASGRAASDGELSGDCPDFGLYFELRYHLEANPNYIELMRNRLNPDDEYDLVRVVEFAPQLFGTAKFTHDIFPRLDNWLLLQCGPGTEVCTLPLRRVADLLEQGVNGKIRRPAPIARDQAEAEHPEEAGADCASDQGDAGQGEGDTIGRTLDRAEKGADWLKVTEAARVTGCNSGEITRAANTGSLKSNGKKGRARRIDPADLSRWQLRRTEREEAVESNAVVEKKLKQGGR
jgi:hypothetical protein